MVSLNGSSSSLRENQISAAPRIPSFDHAGSSLHWSTQGVEEVPTLDITPNHGTYTEGLTAPRCHSIPLSGWLIGEATVSRPLTNDQSLCEDNQNIKSIASNSNSSQYIIQCKPEASSTLSRQVSTQNAILRHDAPILQISISGSTSPRSSLHLHDMRISQRLRSLSSASQSSVTTSLISAKHKSILSIGSEGLNHPEALPFDGFSSLGSVQVPASRDEVVQREAYCLPPSIYGSVTQSRKASTLAEGFQKKLDQEIIDHENVDRDCDQTPKLGPGRVLPVNVETTDEIAKTTPNLTALPFNICEHGATSNAGCGSSTKMRPPSVCLSKRSRKATPHPDKLPGKALNTLTHRKSRKMVLALDGPSEDKLRSLNPEHVTSSRDSISGNFDEAASIWEKALNTQRQNPPGKRNDVSNRMSLSVSRSPLSSTVKGEEIKDDQQETRNRKDSIAFKPIDTTHTFDRLSVPGRMSISGPQLVLPPARTTDEKDNTKQDSKRSYSQPPPANHELLAELEGLTRVVSRSEELPRLSAHACTDTSQPTVNAHFVQPDPHGLGDRRSSSIEAWSRYPSHTRNERSLSAGIADSVVTRDFAPLSSTSEFDDAGEHNEEPTEKRRKRKALSKALRKFFLKDLSARVKPFTSGFRKGESGHRTSIAVSGKLEYPELELLSIGEPEVPQNPEIASEAERPAAERKKSRSVSHVSIDLPPSAQEKSEPTSKVPSSHYSTARSRTDLPGEIKSLEDHNTWSPSKPQHLSVPDWSQQYQAFVTNPGSSKRRKSEDVSPLDGQTRDLRSNPGARSVSGQSHAPGSLSPSSATWSCSRHDQGIERDDLGKSFSMEDLRDSTKDLCNILDSTETKALYAAEVFRRE